MYVSVLFVRGVLSELRRRGLKEECVLFGSGIDLGDLSSVEATVPRAEWERITAAAVRLTGEPALALALSRHLPLSSLQMVGFLIRAAGSLREAVQTLVRYSPLLSESMAWQLQEFGGTARLVLADTSTQRFDIELLLGLAVRFGGELTAGLRAPAVAVELAYPAPEHARAYHQTFPGQVRFSCSHNALVFARELLDAPRMPFVDAQTASRIRDHAENLLLAKAQESIVERTRAFLLQEPDLSAFDPARLARWIGLNERTLRRRLASAGVPLPVLLNEVRRAVALRDLRAPGVTIKQLSERLGFSEPSAFHRAFKRWTGKTPVEFMREPATVDLSARLEPMQNAFVDAGRKLQLKEMPSRQHALHH